MPGMVEVNDDKWGIAAGADALLDFRIHVRDRALRAPIDGQDDLRNEYQLPDPISEVEPIDVVPGKRERLAEQDIVPANLDGAQLAGR